MPVDRTGPDLTGLDSWSCVLKGSKHCETVKPGSVQIQMMLEPGPSVDLVPIRLVDFRAGERLPVPVGPAGAGAVLQRTLHLHLC